ITGLDADGKTISEAVIGPNQTTVETTKYFKSISAVSVSATLGSETMDIGWVDEVATALYPLNWRENVPAGLFQLDVAGTISVDVQFFVADPGRYADASRIPAPVVDADLDGETSDVVAFIEEPGYHAFRVIINSY